MKRTCRSSRRSDDSARDQDVAIARVLRDHAPSWLAHLPSLAPIRPSGPRPVRSERMLRELTEALEALTVADPLVLVLEDLHWSDSATLEWLGYVARRRDSARLLVLGTYRPVEALLHKTPLRDVLAELRHQPQAAEIVLDYLSRDAVHTYLRQRCGGVPDSKVSPRCSTGEPGAIRCFSPASSTS